MEPVNRKICPKCNREIISLQRQTFFNGKDYHWECYESLEDSDIIPDYLRINTK